MKQLNIEAIEDVKVLSELDILLVSWFSHSTSIANKTSLDNILLMLKETSFLTDLIMHDQMFIVQ